MNGHLDLLPVRCHVCGLVFTSDADIHDDHHGDCPADGLCRCDLPICGSCCTDPLCADARSAELVKPMRVPTIVDTAPL